MRWSGVSGPPRLSRRLTAPDCFRRSAACIPGMHMVCILCRPGVHVEDVGVGALRTIACPHCRAERTTKASGRQELRCDRCGRRFAPVDADAAAPPEMSGEAPSLADAPATAGPPQPPPARETAAAPPSAGKATIAAPKTVRVRRPPPPATAEPAPGAVATPQAPPQPPAAATAHPSGTARRSAPETPSPPAAAPPQPAAGGSAGRYASRFR